MKELSAKLRLIYRPFVLMATGFILIYTFLHWLLFIKAGIPLKEDIIRVILPLGLSWIPVLIWLRPRLKLLHFKNDNAYFGYRILAWIIITVPTVISQEYLVTATGKLTQLDNISQFSQHDKTKYYSIENCYIDKQHIAVRNTVSLSGKRYEYYNMLIYVVMPILKSNADTVKSENKYWLGKKYHERISNSLPEQEKIEEYKAFAEKSQEEFDETDFGQFTYLELIGNTEDRDEYNNALKEQGQNLINGNIIFEAKTGSFEARNGKKLSRFLGSLGIGLLVYLVFLLFPKIQKSELEKFENGKTIEDADLKETINFFIPRKGFFITLIIMYLNLLIFIIMVFAGFGTVSFKSADLLNWGANFRPLVIEGQWWRLLTSTFLHGGLMHILANMYGLLFIGFFLEPFLGKAKYAFVYLTTGILASIASIWWYDATVSVGASGAIFGLYGFLLACSLLKVFPPDLGKPFLISILVFVGVNLSMGLIGGGADNAAHVGGLASGFFLGLIMSGQQKLQADKD